MLPYCKCSTACFRRSWWCLQNPQAPDKFLVQWKCAGVGYLNFGQQLAFVNRWPAFFISKPVWLAENFIRFNAQVADSPGRIFLVAYNIEFDRAWFCPPFPGVLQNYAQIVQNCRSPSAFRSFPAFARAHQTRQELLHPNCLPGTGWTKHLVYRWKTKANWKQRYQTLIIQKKFDFEDCVFLTIQQSPTLVNSAVEIEIKRLAVTDAVWKYLPEPRMTLTVSNNITRYNMGEKKYAGRLWTHQAKTGFMLPFPIRLPRISSARPSK